MQLSRERERETYYERAIRERERERENGETQYHSAFAFGWPDTPINRNEVWRYNNLERERAVGVIFNFQCSCPSAYEPRGGFGVNTSMAGMETSFVEYDV